MGERTGEVDHRKVLGGLSYTTLANKTYSFTKEQRDYVLELRALGLADGNGYAEANYKLGEMFGDCTNSLLAESGIDPASIHLIGSHGQTVSGHPHWELGELSVIAQRTGITTAGDFRPADVAAGGNGTPCTCTYDSFMLRPDPGSKWRVAINIGGTASVTFCPPWAAEGASEEEHAKLVPHGLDPGLGVFFMDLCTALIDPTLEFDSGGELARSGTTHEGLLAEFLTDKYYRQRELPIGVGPDDFPETLFHQWRARAQELGVSDLDLLSTLTDHSSKQIALACKKFGGPNIVDGAVGDVLLRGGVVFNTYWVERLLFHCADQLKAPHVTKISTLSDVRSVAPPHVHRQGTRAPPPEGSLIAPPEAVRDSACDGRNTQRAVLAMLRARLTVLRVCVGMHAGRTERGLVGERHVRHVRVPLRQQRLQLRALLHWRRAPSRGGPHRTRQQLQRGRTHELRQVRISF